MYVRAARYRLGQRGRLPGEGGRAGASLGPVHSPPRAVGDATARTPVIIAGRAGTYGSAPAPAPGPAQAGRLSRHAIRACGRAPVPLRLRGRADCQAECRIRDRTGRRYRRAGRCRCREAGRRCRRGRRGRRRRRMRSGDAVRPAGTAPGLGDHGLGRSDAGFRGRNQALGWPSVAATGPTLDDRFLRHAVGGPVPAAFVRGGPEIGGLTGKRRGRVVEVRLPDRKARACCEEDRVSVREAGGREHPSRRPQHHAAVTAGQIGEIGDPGCHAAACSLRISSAYRIRRLRGSARMASSGQPQADASSSTSSYSPLAASRSSMSA
jgi:hypothetical protein